MSSNSSFDPPSKPYLLKITENLKRINQTKPISAEITQNFSGGGKDEQILKLDDMQSICNETQQIVTLHYDLKNAIASQIQQTILKAKEDYQGKIDELETHLEQCANEMLRLESQRTQDEKEKARLKAALESLIQRIGEGQSERTKFKDQLDKATQQVSHAQNGAAQAKVKLETIMDTHKKILEDNQRLDKEIKSLAKKLPKAESEKAVAEARLEEVRSKRSLGVYTQKNP